MDFTQLTMVWSWVIDTWGIPSSFNDEAIFCWTWTYQGYMIETCFFGDFAILAIVFLWNCANKCVKMWSLKSLSGRILQMQKPPTKNCNTTALLYHWNMKSNIRMNWFAHTPTTVIIHTEKVSAILPHSELIREKNSALF